MKLALCIEYPVGQHGGTEVLVRELIYGLAARHEITLVSADDSESLARSGLTHLVCRHIAWRPGQFSSAASRNLADQIAAINPDLVHFHLGENHAWKVFRPWKSPLVAVAKTGIPVMTTNHGAFSVLSGSSPSGWPRPVQWLALPPAWLGKQITLRHCQTEVAVSQNDYRALRRWYPLLRGKFRWIYHSRIREAIPPPFRADREKTIVCAGTIGSRKGQPYLVEAFRRLAPRFPDWQLRIIGRCGEEAMLRQMRTVIAQDRLENQIQLAGPCSDEELRDWLQRAAIFAMPSVWEGLGLSLQEAQFYGCACVGTRCGGVPDLIQDGDNGLLVPARDPAALAAALERLMSDAALRERFSRRAPQSVIEKGMTAPQMVARYERLYAAILKSA